MIFSLSGHQSPSYILSTMSSSKPMASLVLLYHWQSCSVPPGASAELVDLPCRDVVGEMCCGIGMLVEGLRFAATTVQWMIACISLIAGQGCWIGTARKGVD
ncbi:hypothetical protein C8J56DRAFT_1168703 [Mycena floridula]|nr:hypothetical protein C8J56DRAFT_1168703 [Mycena floridula]